MRVLFSVLIVTVPSLLGLGAQPRPSTDGDRPTSLGQPGLWRYSAGGAVGGARNGGTGLGLGEVRATLSRDVLNPVLGLAALQVESYAGARGSEWDGGLRARLSLPFFRAGVAADYNLRDERTRWTLSFMRPLRRGGVFYDGSMARLDISPGRNWSVALGFDKPIQRRIPAGRTRPMLDHVPLEAEQLNAPRRSLSAEVEASLAEARSIADWIGRFTVTWLEHEGADHVRAESMVVVRIEHLRRSLTSRRPDGTVQPRLYEDEVRRFHSAMQHAFVRAVRGSSTTVDSSTETDVLHTARGLLLDEVLLPYDRLLGQDKRDETTREFARRARSIFRRWLSTASGLTPAASDDVLAVFTALLDMVEANRATIRAACHNARMVWLPLQYALLPEEHDTQAELDALVERAVGERFVEGNFVSYVINEQFQHQLSRTILAAKNYHVLWIHDVRGVDAHGDPDEMSFRQVTRSYLSALTAAVRAYDRTGSIPTYMILIDEWFYRVNKTHIWMSLLEDPLRHRTKLPRGHSVWEDSLAAAQAALRQAVAESRLLQAQRTDHGDNWLRSVVKVQVNITHAADPTFWSRHVVKGLAVPDNVYRDHRKLVFYDVTEADPYSGEAIYTGAGVGEHYSNLSWEDRALLVSGPVTLHLKTAARELLRGQGVAPSRIPWHLQPRDRAPDYDERVNRAIAESGKHALRALGVHNAVGFGDKNVNVTKAVLYTMMPPGSVIKIPDSVWNAEFWGSALIGAALRGVRVLVIAPSLANAPARAFGSMQMSYELLWRLAAVSHRLAPELAERGGLLKVGIYASTLPVTNISGKITAVQRAFAQHEWLRTLFAFPPTVFEGLEEIRQTYKDLSTWKPDSTEFEFDATPKLHLKSNLFASREAWQFLARPEWVDMTHEFVQQRLEQVQNRDSTLNLENRPSLLTMGDGYVQRWLDKLSSADRDRVVFYAVMGSQNQNARSMVMDGEDALVISAWPSVIPYIDLMSLIGQSEWLDDPADLQKHLPPQSALRTRMSHWFRYFF